MYGIREGYTARQEPAYFDDVRSDGKVWQPDVLPIAAYLGRRFGCIRIVDIGCGRGYNLNAYRNDYVITGVDYGANIDYCRNNYDWGIWIECDLEKEAPNIAPETLKRSVVVCSDVIEHLANPERLALTLAQFAVCAPLVILTTPDRERTYGYDHNGTPGNPHHVREWTLLEMGKWLSNYTNDLAWAGWTVSNNVDLQKNTMMLILNRQQRVREIQQISVLFDVEAWHGNA